jgi:DNA-binding NtrC family response regulator
MRHNVMLVVDSVSMLGFLQWVFKDESYYLFDYNNPSEALAVINTLKWAVVVAERYLQDMDGIEFLKIVREKSPHTMGIIMTGYAENSELLNKLYPNCVYQFVKKPLDNREIKQAVETAITQYEINVGSK